MWRLFLIGFLLNCSFTGIAQSRSTITGINYNKKKDRTEYLVFPYGSIHLPGRWKKEEYIKSSRQQAFRNDSVFVLAALLPCDKFEFSEPGLEGFAFVQKYYKWEAEFNSNKRQLTTERLVEDSLENYIVFKVFGNNINNTFLFGARGCSVFGISVSTSKWTEEQKILFLKNVYLEKE